MARVKWTRQTDGGGGMPTPQPIIYPGLTSFAPRLNTNTPTNLTLMGGTSGNQTLSGGTSGDQTLNQQQQYNDQQAQWQAYQERMRNAQAAAAERERVRMMNQMMQAKNQAGIATQNSQRSGVSWNQTGGSSNNDNYRSNLWSLQGKSGGASSNNDNYRGILWGLRNGSGGINPNSSMAGYGSRSDVVAEATPEDWRTDFADPDKTRQELLMERWFREPGVADPETPPDNYGYGGYGYGGYGGYGSGRSSNPYAAWYFNLLNWRI